MTAACIETLGVVRCVRSGCTCRTIRFNLLSAGLREVVTANVTNVKLTASSVDTIGCSGIHIIHSRRNFPVSCIIRNSRFPAFNGGRGTTSRVTSVLVGGFINGLGTRPACHGTRVAASVLAVASGVICKGTANTLFDKRSTGCGNCERTFAPLSPKTGPDCDDPCGNTLTTLGSMDAVSFRSIGSNSSCA